MFCKSYLTKFLIIFLIFLNSNARAEVVFEGNNNLIDNVEKKEDITKTVSTEKGFIKRVFKKIKSGISKVYKRIVKRIKRKVSKRKSKKDKNKGSLRNRNKNLFNILIFSAVFILSGALILLSSYYFYFVLGSVLGLIIFYGLGIALLVTSLVIGLIYFSRRYIQKPRY